MSAGAGAGVRELAEDELAAAAALLRRACPYDHAAPVAREKLFGAWPGGHAGATLGVFDRGELAGVIALAGRWIRLFAVDPERRSHGAGRALMDAAEARARGWGATRLRTGDQAGNYLAPGVDARDTDTIAWLERRGFARVAEVENLRVPLLGNPLVTPERARELAAAAAAHGYEVHRASREASAPLLAMVSGQFAPAWAFEVERALGNDPPGVHVAVHRASGEITAFAAHDGNNRGLGWFGPAGTLEAHRGKGLGQALLLPCLLDVAVSGHDHGVIAWIGPRAFYEKTAGAVSDRKFVVLEKPLA